MCAVESTDFDLTKLLTEKAQKINIVLEQLLTEQKEIEPELKKAMLYSLMAPGKRVRSVLVMLCCEVLGCEVDKNAQVAAAAIEMVHTYSLIHDDLPAMDNDDFRRGRPTCHKTFNEATAILAGDGLLTFAFEILADQVTSAEISVKLVKSLAEAAGPSGMIAGQMSDLMAENTDSDIETLQYIHINKTAKMFKCATEMGAICGRADDKQFACLRNYGQKIGLGFQIADDILDVTASSEQLGKTAGKDTETYKCTYPAVVGLEKANELARQLAHDAVDELKIFGSGAEPLRRLALALLERTK